MKPLSQKLKGNHLIRDRNTEILVGLLLFVIGSVFLYDAFNARGKDLPWPASVLAPW